MPTPKTITTPSNYGAFLVETLPAHWDADADHIRLIAEHIDAVENGQIDRLAIHMPPRHAKSETVSYRYPVYCLEREPDSNVLVTGYNERFARKFGRRNRNLAKERGLIGPDKTATDEWETTAGGLFMARGVGSPPMGTGFRRMIIDDPIKRRQDADSETLREATWDWYTDDLYTRLEPGGAIVLIMCLTGDTQVLMADGTEKALRDIRVNDRIATYDKGRITTSTVQNWKNQGSDIVFTIEMESGIIVKGNERHPFLVQRDGYTEWVKIRDLKPGDKILRAECRRGHGRASSVQSKTATSLQSAKGIATPITTSNFGQADTVPPPSIPIRGGRRALKTGMALPLPNMMSCLPRRKESVRCAESRPVQMCQRTGETNSLLTTTTTPERFGVCSATSVTGRSDTEEPCGDCFSPLNTYEVTRDCVVSVSVSGYEEVFDIQVERTENFIANGLVSHNTLWHEDDIGARAVASEPNRWTVLKLPALAQQGDILHRAEGAALWPARWPVSELLRRREVMRREEGERNWEAVYQQNPTPREGSFFKPGLLQIVKALPVGMKSVRAWDMAATENDGDYTAGVRISGPCENGLFYVADVRRGRWGTDNRNTQIKAAALSDGVTVKIHGPQDPGAAGKDAAKAFSRLLAGYTVKTEPVTGAKETRADPFSAQVNAGNVRLLEAAWNSSFIEELRAFPGGKNDDQVDAVSDAFSELTLGPKVVHMRPL